MIEKKKIENLFGRTVSARATWGSGVILPEISANGYSTVRPDEQLCRGLLNAGLGIGIDTTNCATDRQRDVIINNK